MAMNRYVNPPVLEAVCEFRMTPDTAWDLTTPGLLYERIRDTFPHREQRIVQELEVSGDPEGLQHQIRATERILFFTEDRRMFVQLGHRLLSVHALQPYPTWAIFKPNIEKVFRALREVIAEGSLQRVGLRYINRIEIPFVQEVVLEEYFQFYPALGHSLPQKMAGFLVAVELVYADGRDRCRVLLASSPPSKQNTLTYLLDIDYFLMPQEKVIDMENALEWVEEAHSHVEEIFEGCVTDRLRAVFSKEVK